MNQAKDIGDFEAALAKIDEIKKKASWAKDSIFLHDLPIDEARKMYWDNIQEA